MKITFEIYTRPQSFDADDEIENALEDEGLFGDLAYAMEREIQKLMHWRDIYVVVHRSKKR